jgi:hypothetical protein
MLARRWSILAIGVLALLAPAARGHFLFCRIGPPAEAGRFAEVYFSDKAEAGDPKFVEKIAGTRLWLQAKPGEFRPLDVKRGQDRLRALVPAGGSISVVGVCDYGVLSRPNQPAFLLRHYPKAIAGNPAELNAMKPIGKEVPFEIAATLTDKGLRLVGLRDGQPVPNAKFTTIDSSLNNVTLTAGDDGAVVWTPPAKGEYSVYIESKSKQSGTHAGTPYEEIREFATLAFTWPIARSGEDAEAVAMFEKAIADRAQWKNFPGFSAEISGSFEGRPFAGKVDVTADGKVALKVDDAMAEKWASGQISSIVLHRRADSGAEATPVLRFADDDDDHPLGRLLLFEGGMFASSYRIKDGRISVVNRQMGKSNMTITTLAETRNAEGKSLPMSYSVQYWDATSGDLQRVESYQERWTRLGPIDLPASRTMTSAADGGLAVRGFTLTGHKLAPTSKP